jgi:AcrR family transcriptional regulator
MPMKGPRTRASLISAAGSLFSTKGYAATSLEEIGAQLGVSRGTVLFHFDTKLALLFAVVGPLSEDIETVVSEFEKQPTPLAARQRRAFLSRYCDTLAAHPYAARLLVRDLSSITQLNVPATGPGVTGRLQALLEGPHPDTSAKLRSSAALGAILRPLTVPPAELDEDARATLVQCALGAYSAKG